MDGNGIFGDAWCGVEAGWPGRHRMELGDKIRIRNPTVYGGGRQTTPWMRDGDQIKKI